MPDDRLLAAAAGSSSPGGSGGGKPSAAKRAQSAMGRMRRTTIRKLLRAVQPEGREGRVRAAVQAAAWPGLFYAAVFGAGMAAGALFGRGKRQARRRAEEERARRRAKEEEEEELRKQQRGRRWGGLPPSAGPMREAAAWLNSLAAAAT